MTLNTAAATQQQLHLLEAGLQQLYGVLAAQGLVPALENEMWDNAICLQRMLEACGRLPDCPQAVTALQDTEERFHLLVEGVKDYAIFLLDPTGCVISWNAGAERIKGYTAEEVLGRHVSLFYTPDAIAESKPDGDLQLAQACEHGYATEAWRVRKDGSRYWANVVTTALWTPDGTLRGYAKVTRDITERKRIEDEYDRLMANLHAANLVASYERSRWQATVDSMLEPVTVSDAEGRTIYMNAAYSRLIGSPPAPTLPPGDPTEHDQLFHPDGTPFLTEDLPLQRAALRGDEVYQAEVIQRTDTGEERVIIWNASPIQAGDGTITGAVAVGRDMTEQRRFEREREELLHEVQRRMAELDATITSLADGLVIYNVEGRIVRMNAEAERLLGYSDAERTLPLPERLQLLRPATEDARPLLPDDVATARALRGEVVNGQVLVFHRPDRTVWLSISAAPIRTQDGQTVGAITSLVDITRLKEMEEALAHEVQVNASMAEMARLLLSLMTVADIDDQVLAQAQELTHSPFALVGAFETGTDHLVITAVSSEVMTSCAIEDRRAVLEHSQSMWSWIIAARQPVLINNLALDTRAKGTPEGHIPISRVLAAPALVDGELVGLIAVGNAPEDYTPQDLQVIDGLSTLYALARARSQEAETLQATLTREQQQRQMLDAIFASAPVGLLLIDDERRILRSNAIANSLLAVEEQAILGTRLGEAFGCTSPDVAACGSKDECTACSIWQAAYRAFTHGETTHLMEMPIWVRRAGVLQTIWLLVSIVGSTRNGRQNVLVTLLDITARKQMEMDLQLAREHAIAANQAKSDFLSRMSHELRTPMNAILGFAQLLEMDVTTPEQEESVEQILKGGRHLLDLINEILDISRIESGKIHLTTEQVSVCTLVEDLIALTQPLAASRTIHLRNDTRCCGCTVQADYQRLKQVLLNLISNAIKYNTVDGSVTLTCETPAGEGHLRLGVVDTGYGIPADQLERLFQPFERLHADQQGIEGTGLGLVLSKRLVEAMGGTIGVESRPGEGSTFWVELPLCSPSPAQSAVEASANADAVVAQPAVHTVLYIEDNLANTRLLERVLHRWPRVELLPAMQGRLGLELAQQHQPDLILLDLNLPDMPGDHILHTLKRDPATAAIPVIIISADATPGQIARLLEAGALAYLTKPFELRQLYALLDGLWQDGSAPTE